MSRSSSASLAVVLAAFLALAATATAADAEPLRTVERNGIKTELKRWQSCTALAPADWSIVGNEVPVGIGVDLAAGDGSMLASFEIPVDGALRDFT